MDRLSLTHTSGQPLVSDSGNMKATLQGCVCAYSYTVCCLCCPGIQSHSGSGPTEGQRDPGEAEGTLRESTSSFFYIQ